MALHQAKTQYGQVEGTAGGNPAVTVFRGIPYAAPPVGELRWKPPQPPAAWEGVRPARAFSGICPQPPNSGFTGKEAPPPLTPCSEDCLYLNVWTPARDPGEKLPVLFWIHGGANVRGYGHMPQFDGEGFAKRGIITVTFNWRVNVFGWLVHSELSAESDRGTSGNYALLDQIAALRWVRENIAAFGGDPDRITVAGESAGGSSAQLLCLTPLTRGMVSGAILQSVGGFDLFSSRAMGTQQEMEQAVDLQRVLGVSTIAQARQLDAMEIVRRISRPEAAGAYLPMAVADGYVLPGTMKQLAVESRYHKIPYIIGYTEDETGMYEMPPDREGFLRGPREEYGPLAGSYITLCPFLVDDEDFGAHLRVRSAELLKTGALVWAELLEEHGTQTPYVYCFTRQMPGDDAGAYHSAELWYQFQTLHRNWRPFSGADYELSRQMADYWGNFIRSGDPNGSGLPRWERYRKARPLTMDLGLDMRMKDFGENPRVTFRKNFILDRLGVQGQ